MKASKPLALPVQALVTLAREAGQAILEIYQLRGKLHIETKSDDSPVTEADLIAHQIIAKGLPAIENLPMLSEEGKPLSAVERAKLTRYWLIDPLDGTKEFIGRTDDFTVNIALIEQGKPILGVVYAPVRGMTYIGINGTDEKAAYAISDQQVLTPLQTANITDRARPLIITASRRHGKDALKRTLSEAEAGFARSIELTEVGSSLKFCLIAEGRADCYPRFAPTSEWDTAAAQAVLEAAGGAVWRADHLVQGNKTPLSYNTGESLLNPFFIAVGDVNFNWQPMVV